MNNNSEIRSNMSAAAVPSFKQERIKQYDT